MCISLCITGYKPLDKFGFHHLCIVSMGVEPSTEGGK
jgi:hypothetical protein